LAWSELKIGVVAIAAMVIAAVMIFSLTGSRGFSWQRYQLKTRFANVAGLASGSPVRVAGVEVGTVRSIAFAGEQVDVTFEVNKNVRSQITDKSVAFLGSVSLLGEGAVDITPSATGTPIPEGGYVTARKARGSIADVAEQATTAIEESNQLVKDVRAGKGTVGQLLTNDKLYNDLQGFAASAAELTRSIRDGKGTMGRLVNDRKTADSLEASMKNLEALTTQINSGQGSFGKLIKDEAFANSLNATTANLRDVLDRINRGDGTFGKLITDPSLFNRVNAVSTQFDTLMTQLNAGQGTAGQLLKDKQLYENMNGAVTDLRTLINAITKDPKKYLAVKVSVF
jgi:phospholipid/cholesterol/gamma-HCH transport system substrate-binding protein